MKKFNREDILYVAGLFIIVLWTLISITNTIIDPPSVNDMTVEERIRYEQMIFP